MWRLRDEIPTSLVMHADPLLTHNQHLSPFGFLSSKDKCAWCSGTENRAEGWTPGLLGEDTVDSVSDVELEHEHLGRQPSHSGRY